MKATYHKYILHFKQASGTSRGVLTDKETWFLVLENEKDLDPSFLVYGLNLLISNYEKSFKICYN
jgi:hypothetical protein